ncbi:MAG: phosphoribosyltransferase domain-containing protein [Muribaculaceae bacterium]|nr:phosphoribosyltransferase domain-containing protein [Muribaculaceae bacterium]
MQVLTLSPHEFDLHTAKLARMVEEDDIGCFDAIVAIRRGGSFVCDSFCNHFAKDRYQERYDLTLQRPSTKRKSGLLGKLLKSLPLPILDKMRMVESALLEMRRKIKGPGRDPNVDVPVGLANLLGKAISPKILIIDDAIDSGDTLIAIVNSLTKLNPKSILRIAVVTETTHSPRLHADYTLYRNRTLIRFPWSNDYKDKR